MPFSDYCGGKSLVCKAKLSFLSTLAQTDQLLVSGMRTKQSFEREKEPEALLFIFFVLLPVLFCSYSIFPLVAGLPLDFIYEVKVSQKMLKVKFFNKKWQVVGRSDFS